MIGFGENVEKLEDLDIIGGNVKLYNHFKNSMEVAQKCPEVELFDHMVILFLIFCILYSKQRFAQ